ncbi:CHAT domain-containing tetratricopeptide repeat protein [Stakelama tenebrarum]|uniref:CHAT domain-containing protein n=1 Tax=Stakelama tenebrarum TaxID=2711215 RepID=A0A6G6Y3U7_9SPHN|nr:CHAT domain-containing tetratricopeptide repeat protein [Sphingosinithalassobacter tenebrarum]QIG79602.1 CHAT domain-containing protein [Sphingosinithalassobacter tenebrarum]
MPGGVGDRLIYRGAAYYHLKKDEAALVDLQRAHATLASAGLQDSELMISVLDMIGSTYTDMGDLDRGLSMKRELLDRIAARQGPESSLYADALYTIGFIEYQKGDVEAALRDIRTAVRIKRDATAGTADPDVAMYWISEASLLNILGRVPEALESSRAVALWSEANLGSDHLLTASTLHNFGALLGVAGRHGEAIPILRRALAARERLLGGDNPQTALTLNSLAYSLERTGKVREAEQLYLASSAIFEANPDSSAPQTAGAVLLNASSIAAGSGRWEEATERAERARTLVATRAGTENLSYARVSIVLAELALQRGDASAALAFLEPALETLHRISEPYQTFRVRAEVLHGLAMLQAGQAAEGLDAARPAYIAIRERMRSDLVADETRLRTEEAYSQTLTLFAQLALEAGDPGLGLEALQLARLGDLERSGRMLAARAAAAGSAGTHLRELQDLVRQEQQLRAALSTAVAQSDSAAIREAEAALAQTDRAIRSARGEVATAFPGYAAAQRPELVRLEGLRERIPANGAILIAQPGLMGILTVAVTREGIAWHLTPRKRNEFQAAVTAIRTSVEDRTQPFALADAHLLYSAIFGADIAPLLAGKERLDILAGGYLSVIPFSLLVERAPQPGETLADAAWLVRRFAISTPLNIDRAEPRSARSVRPVRFAGFGDPALAPAGSGEAQLAVLVRGGGVSVQDIRDLPSLPGAGEELAAMARTFDNPGNLLLTGSQATETAIRAIDFSRYSVLAFATHGLVGGQLGGLDEPALVMTPPDTAVQDDDGLLTASEIARLRLDADWVILSACNTAAGSDAGTPTYSGLAQAFVFAGARSLLLSHWRVRDDAAARLSVATVRGAAQGLGKAEALRRAQLELMADPDIPDAAHPAIWAPFILIES